MRQRDLLHQHAARIEDRCRQSECDAQPIRVRSRPSHRDQHDACECHPDADEESAREPLAEEQSCEHRDEDRREVDQQSRRAGVEMLFGPVERHGVEREPRDAVHDDQHQATAARQRRQSASEPVAASHDHHDRHERDHGGRQSAECQRTGRERLARRPDGDEGRRPQEHGDRGCDGGEIGGSTRHAINDLPEDNSEQVHISSRLLSTAVYSRA